MKGIITADWHLRKDVPRCRTETPEEWWETQKRIVIQIIQEAENRDCLLYIVGDIFHTSVVQEEIKTFLLTHLLLETRILPGQHDLPYHSWENVDRSSFGILMKASCQLTWNKGFPSAPFGHDHNEEFFKWHSSDRRDIRFTHQLTFASDKDRPVIDGKKMGKTAEELLAEFPEAKWIFTGDQHKHFHYEKDGRHVINPGCMTRQAADFKDYKPGIFYVDTEIFQAQFIELNDTAPVVTDEYLRKEEDRDDRIEFFITTLRKKGEVSLNFIDNLQTRMNSPDIDKGTKSILTEVIEEVS